MSRPGARSRVVRPPPTLTRCPDGWTSPEPSAASSRRCARPSRTPARRRRRREPSARPVDAGRAHRVHAQHGRRPRPRRGRVDVGAVRGGSDARQGPPGRHHRPPRRPPVRRRPDVQAAPRHRRGRHRHLGLARAGRATPRSTACSTSTRRPSAARERSSAAAASTPSSTPSASSTTSPAPDTGHPHRSGPASECCGTGSRARSARCTNASSCRPTVVRGPPTCCAAGHDSHTSPGRSAMKAAAYTRTGGPDVLEYVEVPDPELRPGGVILDIEAVSIQGGDLLHRAGGLLATNPHVVGYQAAGTIQEVGAAVEGLDGRPAASSPRWATAATPSWRRCRRSPSTRSPTACRSRPPPASRSSSARPTTACSSSATCRPGEAVLVQAGAGGVGLAAIQLAKAAGASIGHRHRVERRAARAAPRVRHGPRHQLRPRRRRRQGPRGDRRPGRRPRRRPGRRLDAGGEHRRAGLPRPRQLGRPRRTRAGAARGVAADGEERVAHRRLPRRRDGSRPGPRAHR